MKYLTDSKMRFCIAIVSLCFSISGNCSEPAEPNSGEQADSATKSPEEIFEMARKVLHGRGVAKNPTKALELMRKAAAAGHADAIGGIGYFHLNGLAGLSKSDAEALGCFRQGSDKGGNHAHFHYGQMLVRGLAVDKDSERGMMLIKKAGAAGIPEANRLLGHIYFEGHFDQQKDALAALSYYIAAADAGDAEAQCMVGVCHEFGYAGLPSNTSEATKWYRQAAEKGHPKAMANLGKAIGLLNAERSARVEALSWLILAKKLREPTAIVTLRETQPALDKQEFLEASAKATAKLAQLRTTHMVREMPMEQDK